MFILNVRYQRQWHYRKKNIPIFRKTVFPQLSTLSEVIFYVCFVVYTFLRSFIWDILNVYRYLDIFKTTNRSNIQIYYIEWNSNHFFLSTTFPIFSRCYFVCVCVCVVPRPLFNNLNGIIFLARMKKLKWFFDSMSVLHRIIGLL